MGPLINHVQFGRILHKFALRYCSDLSIVKTELEVPTFCDIHIDLACKVRVRPFNVHKYHNSNAFLLQTDQKYDNAVEHYVDGNRVIVHSPHGVERGSLCSIKAPIKANLHINAKNDVSVGYFHGDKLHITTEGNVFVDRFQGDSLKVHTSNGNIILNNSIQATTIFASTINGSINAGRLQALTVKLSIDDDGSMTVQSSYANDSQFILGHGHLDLNNLHSKKCEVTLGQGQLVLGNFDGNLTCHIDEGDADLHLARLNDHPSTVNVKQGHVTLRLTDTAIPAVTLTSVVKNLQCTDEMSMEHITSNGHNTIVLRPATKPMGELTVDAPEVDVKLTTWQEMMNMKFTK